MRCASVLVACLLVVGCRGDLDAGDTGTSSDSTGDDSTTGVEGGSECAGPDSGFVYAFEVAATDSCYAIRKDYVTWSTAEAVCADWGGHLAALTTADEHAAVSGKMVVVGDALAAYELWIGASLADGQWTWSSQEPFDFTAWGPDQPNEPGETACVALNDSTGYQWHDEPCSYTTYFLCER